VEGAGNLGAFVAPTFFIGRDDRPQTLHEKGTNGKLIAINHYQRIVNEDVFTHTDLWVPISSMDPVSPHTCNRINH
jgi:hypothetical protein